MPKQPLEGSVSTTPVLHGAKRGSLRAVLLELARQWPHFGLLLPE